MMPGRPGAGPPSRDAGASTQEGQVSSPDSPRTVLLATDLSSRCDRALDRSLQLARRWNARLVVMTVVEPEPTLEPAFETPSWRRAPDRKRAVEARLRRDLGEHGGGVTVKVAEGDPASAILDAAKREQADLVLTGIARDETLGRYILGSTVDRVAPNIDIPILVVKSRPRLYEEVLVATDFSPLASNALSTAAAFFPFARLTLLHGWQVPFAGFLDKGDFRDEWREQKLRASEAFIRHAALGEEQRGQVKMLVEHGPPEMLIHAYMQDHAVDLVVVAAHGASGVFERRLGGTAKRILETAPGDVLIVPERLVQT